MAVVDNSNPQLITADRVAEKLSRSSRDVWRLCNADTTFPRPVKIGQRGTRWLESEVDAWIVGLAASRNT